MKSSFPPETLIEILGRHFFLGRSSSVLPDRHAVFNSRKYREALERLPASPTPAQLAARGRLRRFLGEPALAEADFDAAIAAAPDLAAAHAWRWELLSAAGPTPLSGIEEAVRLEPSNGWWRLWLALGRTNDGFSAIALKDAAAAIELLPDNPFALAVYGLIHFKLNEYADALPFLDKALRLAPEMEWVWRLRAMCRHETGDKSGCLADCIEAMRLDENAGLLFIMLGLHKHKTETHRSIDISTRHIEANPDDFWAYVFRADNRRSPEIGNNLGALEDLRRAAELAPGHGWVWAYLARCQVTLNDFRAAGESMARAVKIDPNCGWVQAWRGEFMRRAGDSAGAKKALDTALKLFPDYELGYAWRGSVLRLLDRPEEALEDLGIAIRLKPHTLDLCYFERMLTYRALGRVAEALQDVQRATELNPKYVWETEPKRFGQGLEELDAEIKRNPKNPLAHLWRGDLMMRVRDFKRAERDLSRAVARPDAPLDALILRGRTRGELGKWKQAFADFNAAIKRSPGSVYPYAWRGRASMLLGKNKLAISDFERAIEKEKNAAWILSWLGEAEFKLKRYADAERSLTKALNLHHRFADAFLWRGAARLRLGAAGAAAADLTQAIDIRPGDALAHYYRGHAALQEGRPIEARADFAIAVAKPGGPLSRAQRQETRALLRKIRPTHAPTNHASIIEMARGLQKEGRHQDAVSVYTDLLAKSADDIELLRLRSDAYRCLGRYDLALKDQNAIVALRPGQADALTGRIETKRHLWDFEGGLKDAEQATVLDPKSASAWVSRAECLRSLGRYDEAIASATTAVACDPTWNWALVVRAKARRQKGDLEGALSDTREAEKAGTDAYARGWRAEILRKSGRLAESLQDIVVAVTMQPTNAWFLALRGQIQVELGAHEKGLADLLEAMRVDPRCSCDYDFMGAQGPLVRQDTSLAWVYAWRAGAHRAESRIAEARADLDHAARLAPDCFWILAWHAEILLFQNETKASIEEFKRALKLGPRYSQAWIWAGQALLKDENTAEAMKAFKTALGIEPNNVWGLIGQAVCLEKNGKSKQAVALFARARAIAPALFSQQK